MPESNFQHTLQQIANNDVTTLVKKDAEYGSSWKKRGGVGAFMMLARKWDRLENQVNDQRLSGIDKFDVFASIEQEVRGANTETVLETVRDLRRYLLLVESEIELRAQVERGGTVVPPSQAPGQVSVPPEGGPIPEEEDKPTLTFETRTPGHLISFDRMLQGGVSVVISKQGTSSPDPNRLLNANQVQKLKKWL